MGCLTSASRSPGLAPGFSFKPDCNGVQMAHNVRIPLAEGEAVALLGRVKPTAEMPRQGAHATKGKKKQIKRKARKG
jgi:hypothetical protein